MRFRLRSRVVVINLWGSRCLGKIALESFNDPTLARGTLDTPSNRDQGHTADFRGKLPHIGRLIDLFLMLWMV